MSDVTLSQILQAREDRARLQHELLSKHCCPLICFTMNIAGPVKNSPLIQRGFQTGMELLAHRIPEVCIRARIIDISATGCQALYAVDMPAVELKQICISIEDGSPLGRLFDMDVLGTDGLKLERQTTRGCIVCGAPGRGCAASRAHSVAELQSVTSNIFQEYFCQHDAEHIATLAQKSLIDEVHTTPKPGLVDRRNNGSHKDMSIRHFIASANSLKSYFAKCVTIGRCTAQMPHEDTFRLLRQAGIEAEKTMYCATDGVNTHKGIIYTMGILCGSIGRLWAPEAPIPETTFILEECSRMVHQSVQQDYSHAIGATAGEKLYLKYGLGGIRAEVAAGLPSVAQIALPCYRQALNSGLSHNDAGTITLLHLIAQVADTNLYHRGGATGAAWAASTVTALLHTTKHPTIAQLEELDDAFIAQNLSPGGCADLLAVTYFLHSLNP